jgi:hypothetical protein
MILPVSISKVQYYKISGEYSYEGELIITDGVLYFFPFVDLEEKRFRKNMFIGGGCVWGLGAFLFALIFGAILSLIGGIIKPLRLSTSHSKLRKQGLWSDGDSSAPLQKKLDAYIEEMKEKKLTLSSSMPVPSRFPKEGISNLTLSLMGEMRFAAQSDRHDFSIGVVKKASVREALKEGGFTA